MNDEVKGRGTSELTKTYNELLEARLVIDRQQQQINELLNSTSWKIMKPYRIIGIFIKKVINKGKKNTKFLLLSISKSFKWLRQYGFTEGSKLIADRIRIKIAWQKHQNQLLVKATDDNEWEAFENWLDNTPHSFIDIFSVPMGWNTKLFQRFQHISLNVGKIGGIAIYGAHPSVDSDVEIYKFVTPTLCIINLDCPSIKNRMFQSLNKRTELKYIRIQSIDLSTQIKEIQEYLYRGYFIVYEYIDELTPQITGDIPDFVYERHNYLLKNKRIIVITTSDKLFKQAIEIRKDRINMAVSTNGVDYDYWNAKKELLTVPEDLKSIVNKGKKIVGYHGALAKWIDYAALEEIAKDGRFILLLIGFEHDESLKKSKLLEIENVHYLGSKPYCELVSYAVWYDVAILPFIINEITLSVSPVKIFEYMALSKPIVSSALPECKKYKSCMIANSPEDYIKKLSIACKQANNIEYLNLLEKEAKENTWAEITKHTVELVYKCQTNETKIYEKETEPSFPDVLDLSMTVDLKNKYINQILDISSNTRSIFYKSITDSYYKRQNKDAKIIAYYLTQFHPDPHNEKWWGKGVTEWNNVVRAVPQYLDHYQPRVPGELGYYDLRIIDIMKRQIELAKMYGVYGFSFYYYWFNGKRLLEQPLEEFLKHKELVFPFSLCWANENWTKRFDGTNTDILMEQPNTIESYKNVIHDMIRFLIDDRYIEINNKKVITVYRPSLMPKVKEVLKYWRDTALKNGIGELYLIAVKENSIEMDWLKEGYDALSEFHPGTLYRESTKINDDIKFIRKDFEGEVFSYEDIVKSKKYFNYSYNKLYRAVMPMWDNTARRNNKGMIYHGSTPTLYKEWLVDVIRENCEKHNVDDNVVFINAWNEWGEGTYLEPDRFYGYAYLNATKEAVEECRGY